MMKPAAKAKRAAVRPTRAGLFWVTVDSDSRWEERLPESAWPPAATVAADRFLELVFGDPEVAGHVTGGKRACWVLGLRLVNYPEKRTVQDFQAVSRALRTLMMGSRRGMEGLAFRPLLGSADSDDGQVEGAVIVVNDAEESREFRRRVQDKEGESRRATKARHEQIRELLEKPADADYDRLIVELRELSELTRQEMAERLAPALTQRVKSMRQLTYEDKQRVATWINNEIRPLGLAVKCPATGQPGILIVDLGGAAGDVSRFRVESHDASGKRIRKFLAGELHTIDLVPAMPRGEGAARPKSPRLR